MGSIDVCHCFFVLFFCTGAEFQLSTYDVHAVSSALKLYLRELPIPLISYEAYDLCLIATSELSSWSRFCIINLIWLSNTACCTCETYWYSKPTFFGRRTLFSKWLHYLVHTYRFFLL